MKDSFLPGIDYIPTTRKVFDHREINNIIKVAKDGYWTEGEFAKKFEKRFTSFLSIKHTVLVNSGSSANLLAVAALTSKVFKKRALKKGDEFITTAVAFPTTVNPGFLYGLKPVFVDIDLKTLNINISGLKKAITKKTKLIILAHTLGNPFDLVEIKKIARKNNIWLIEDCCDALGSTYKGKYLGGFGDLATFSFYPAHQITMAEGGAVVTSSPLIYRSLRQFRDWGRDCWCGTGEDNSCGKRFSWQLGKLPFGYDHKYIYSQIGYNLKLTDFQAAIGVAQMDKLPQFIRKRQENYLLLKKGLEKYNKYFFFQEPEKNSNPCWFGFMIILKDKAPFTRLELVKYLESKKIGTRNLFAGNILKHPAYLDIKCRKIGRLKNSDKIMNDGFWIGVFPGIDKKMINYIIKQFAKFLNEK